MQVTVSRRGLRNQLKTFLFRSKSNATAETPRAGATPSGAGGANQYGAATTEGQMRQLADLAFVMQDYETAQSTLKLLAGDYKTDKAFKHLAGVQVSFFISHLSVCYVYGVCVNSIQFPFQQADEHNQQHPGDQELTVLADISNLCCVSVLSIV